MSERGKEDKSIGLKNIGEEGKVDSKRETNKEEYMSGEGKKVKRRREKRTRVAGEKGEKERRRNRKEKRKGT